MEYKLFTDGGARGNPGPAGIGALLFDSNDKLIWLEAKYINKSTNNIAEYKALLLGLNYIKDILNPQDNLVCYLDSELVVKQLNKEYKVKNDFLKILNNKVLEVIKGFNVKFVHVRREKNKFADKLVNICLDSANE